MKSLPSPEQKLSFYGDGYHATWADEMKSRTFQRLFSEVSSFKRAGKLLDVGCGWGVSLQVARQWGWDAEGWEVGSGVSPQANIYRLDFETTSIPGDSYDAILFFDVLEHFSDPVAALQKTHSALRPEGIVIVHTPSTRSLSAKILGSAWPHIKAEHLFYFSPLGLRRLLEKAGFRCLQLKPSVKSLCILYADRILYRYPVPILSSIIRAFFRCCPPVFQKMSVPLPSGEILVIAQKVTK